jgi:hypothetical protein
LASCTVTMRPGTAVMDTPIRRRSHQVSPHLDQARGRCAMALSECPGVIR